MRTKGTVNKLFPGSTVEERKMLADFGAAFAPENRLYHEIAFHWMRLLEVRELTKTLTSEQFAAAFPGWKTKDAFENDFTQWSSDLLNRLAFTLKTGDGSYLKCLVGAAEAWGRWRQGQPSDPLRSLLLRIYFSGERQVVVHTIRQVQYWVQMGGGPTTDIRHLRDVCREIGLKIASAKTGRPKKKNSED